MKKIVSLTWLLLLLFSACQKHEDAVAPADRPDARLNEALTAYKTQLTSAEYGWKAMLYPTSGEVYTFLLKFSPNDRVTMSGDINSATAVPLESSYRLKAMQKPSLLFDTYSHLHILADPDPGKNGGELAQGRRVDFEFSFESANAESITLAGQQHGSKLVLTKATQAEATNYNRQVAANTAAMEQANAFTAYFKRLTIGASAYDIQVDIVNRVIVFTYFVGEAANIFTTGFYYSAEGLVLLKPFIHDGRTISTLQGLNVATGSRQVKLTINNEAATIQEAGRPVKVDVQGARNFFNSATGNDYWMAGSGFTVNGVPDALKVSELPNFEFLALWPKYGTSGATAFDLLAYVKLNAAGNGYVLGYGTTAVSGLTNDGRIVYRYLDTRGTVPPGEEPVVTATRAIWTEAQGFFVIRTGDSSIDLVSAKDGKAWLSIFR